MITFGGCILTDTAGFWLLQPVPSPNPIGEGAIRFRFENTSLDPVAAELSIYGEWTQVIDITSGQPIPGLWDYYPNLRKANFFESLPRGALTVESCGGLVDIVDIKLSTMPWHSPFFQDAFRQDTALNKVNIESLTAEVNCQHMFEESGVTEANVLMDSATETQVMFNGCLGLKRAYIRTTNGIGVNCFEYCRSLEDLTIEITGNGYFIHDDRMQDIGYGHSLRYLKFIAAEGTSYRINSYSDCTEVFAGAQLLESITVYERGTSGQLTQVPLPLTGHSNSAFSNCIGLTYIPLLDVSGVTQCIEMFNGCVNIAGGILDVYDVLKIRCSSYGDHIQAFHNCGINSTTGRAELAQIPADWK